MGNGQHPGPTDAATAFPVDDGTLARISSPPPAPIGLKGGNAKGGTASLGEQVASYVRQRRGQVVGDGECFTAADNALRNANARSAADYGTVTPDADYQWGTPVNQSDLRTGDIIQFRNYRYDREIETGHTDGSSETQTDMWLGGNGRTASESEQQSVTIPSTATSASLSFWGRFDTAEHGSTVYDTLKVQVVASGVTTTLATYSNVGADATWTQRTFDLTSYRGKSVTVRFVATEDSSAQTSFVIDDTALTTR